MGEAKKRWERLKRRDGRGCGEEIGEAEEKRWERLRRRDGRG